MRVLPFLPLVLSLLLVSCQDDVSPKDVAIQQEVANRVEVIRGELKVDEDRRMTIRIVCFTLLAGVSLVLLFRHGSQGRWFQDRSRSARPISSFTEHQSPPATTGQRVIDPPIHGPPQG